MIKYTSFFMLLAIPAYAHHVIDVLGGTGPIWGYAKQSEYEISNGTAKAKLSDSIYMRESIFLAARYSNYSGMNSGFFVWGFELATLMTRPTVAGEWIYTRADKDDKINAESREQVVQGSAPALNTGHVSFHLGYNTPIHAALALELGMLGGVGYGEGKYSYQSAYSLSLASGASNGSAGPAVHAALRFALQFFPKSPVAFAIEYRLYAEAFGSFFALLPFIQSSTALGTTTGHLFLASVGYRFGFDRSQEQYLKR